MVTKKNEKDSSRTQLIISIISLVIVIALLITGVTLFFVIRERTGTIEIDGTNVDIEATSTIEGMENPPQLPTIIINSESEPEQEWTDINLVFADKESEIKIFVTIVNNSTSAIDLVFDNRTTEENINMVEQYYVNGDIETINNFETENYHSIRLYDSYSVTYVLTFTVKNPDNSVNDNLDIIISCINVEAAEQTA